MKLNKYIEGSERGALTLLAKEIGAHLPDVSRWVSGDRPIPSDRCPAMELATNGSVTCEELRPDICWHRVPDTEWPHPKGRPLIDVAATSKEAA